MASFGSRNRHLDASSGREVVLCHRCRHEWYRDDRESLRCPICDSEAVEIIEPENDPREASPDIPFPFPPGFGINRSNRYRAGSDSDPEEDDIESHMAGGVHRDRLGNPPPPGEPANRRVDGGDVILRRFADMLMNDLGGSRQGRNGAPMDSLFLPRGGLNLPRDDEPGPFGFNPTSTNSRSSGSGTTIQRTTFRHGPMTGTATFTIVSSNVPEGAAGPGIPAGFPTLFGQIMSNASPPPGGEDRPEGQGARATPGNMGFATGLHEILASLLNPQAAVHGDAVYTQEALDRIITSLMEASPSSNAAPPASQSAIERLEKKKADDNMLGPEGKAECTICIEELHKGDEVTVLPCSHWFHGECVVLWLIEHNTCPICRAPIEERNGQGSNQQASQQQTPQSVARASFSPLGSIFAQPRPRDRFTRTPEEQERLNSIRNAAFRNELYRSAEAGGAPASNAPFRRNSLSPSSTRDQASSSRSRVRSPSLSRDQDSGVSHYDRGDYLGTSSRRDRDGRDNRDNRDRNNQGGSSHGGAFSWIRDHLRSYGGNSERDRRR